MSLLGPQNQAEVAPGRLPKITVTVGSAKRPQTAKPPCPGSRRTSSESSASSRSPALPSPRLDILPPVSGFNVEDSTATLRQQIQDLVDDPEFIEFQCPICLDVLQKPVKTVCGHGFCERCLRLSVIAMLDRSECASCPLCRQSLRTDDDVVWDHSVTVRMRQALAEKHHSRHSAVPPASRTGKVIHGRSPLLQRVRQAAPSDVNDLATFMRGSGFEGRRSCGGARRTRSGSARLHQCLH